jgi:single-strand DNA-binding protein
MKKIIVTGNVGRDPELRADQNGNQFATFSVGVSVGTKQNPKTDWVDVSCNGKLADVARNYVKKGSKLLIEGFPTVNAYINKENKAVGTLRINANNFEFIGGRPDSQDDYNQDNAHDNSSVYSLPESNNDSSNSGISSLKSDDIPF